ncbi:hypothetical protein BU26DRAFT_295392 [Trematosphaeria pertusa]|uniref:JmjC domain-containing protein n=1 Tax=Trematosphaeria pertusa TaxID=390896 RepID=A0A6A6IJP1_9PLEO|nr:uncharacterized protein BU26DRAFT_295392 [Trematosphaeria pertusa]KAF2250092.1 hypothetical protein BU26DRAFT_295392 [Trematosphaeria pertusa]
MPHVDRHGVITTAEGVDGDKLWLSCLGLTLFDLRAWLRSEANCPHQYPGPISESLRVEIQSPAIRTQSGSKNHKKPRPSAKSKPLPSTGSEEESREFKRWKADYANAPAIKPIAIKIRAGDLLIQPSGNLHAPYTCTNVLMRGTMHWDSLDLEQILELSLLETAYPQLTNEDEAKDFYHLMQRCIARMKECKLYADDVYKWPPPHRWESIDKLFKEWQGANKETEPLKTIMKGCVCTLGACDSCACFHNHVRCGTQCHKADKGGENSNCRNC